MGLFVVSVFLKMYYFFLMAGKRFVERRVKCGETLLTFSLFFIFLEGLFHFMISGCLSVLISDTFS